MAKNAVLSLERHQRTPERLREIASQVAVVLRPTQGEISVDDLVKVLESEFDVWITPPVVVSDPDGHEPWLEQRRAGIKFSYWKRYRTLLSKRWKPGAIEALDGSTDQILGLMEDPKRPGSWKTYGMVYGQVQSGKTASYTGVISKAVDAGYQVVIVLTSQHESLRHQTQARLDLEFLGFNSKFTRDSTSGDSMNIGVGTLGLQKPEVACLTLTTRDSDFTAAKFQGSAIDIHSFRVLVVSKKNKRILENLRDWLANAATTGPDSSRLIRNAPLLLIDDEADYASVDTKKAAKGRTQSDPDHDPTAINKAIRELLELFEKRVYLAYTATPFANIFISESTSHEKYGADLFPRSFMVALEPPSNYCGPEVVFGLEDPSAAEIREPLPIIREIGDHEDWMPDGHRKGHMPELPLPASLVEALDAFVLSTAVRGVRRDQYSVGGGHNTMLIHVTRFTDVQGQVARQVQDHLRATADAWGDYGEAGRSVQRRLAALWEKDFAPTYDTLAEYTDVSSSIGPQVTWDQVRRLVPEVLENAAHGVRRINGTAADVLDYQSTTPVTVVAVGGDKLSRGLTLEGLSVSYYLRTSQTYDTLLQMGRWFGYRPGYLDATRLYTTPELVGYYVHITRANRELMDLTSAVARAGGTPKRVGLRVMDGVGNLQVTASAKMRSTKIMTVSFSGTRVETLVMLTSAKALRHNHAKLEKLVAEILPYGEVPPDRREGIGDGFFREGVPSSTVLDFFTGFAVSPRVLAANPENLTDYIRAQNDIGELTRWTVAVTAGNASNMLSLPGADIAMVKRKTITGHARVQDGEFEVGVLVSPIHESLGLSRERYRRAYERTVEEFRKSGREKKPARASGESLRGLRDPEEGLLLIYPIDPATSKVAVPAEVHGLPALGYAVVFPVSDRAQKVKYRVNEIFLNNLATAMGDDEEENEDQ
ncbi:Z1 domain-containing protein [Nonomuraea sp. NPDC049377]